MKKDEKCYFYVYVTYHGVSSEISCLHVGYEKSAKPINCTPPDWYSKGVTNDIANKVYEKIKYYNNCNGGQRIYARKDIEYWIKHFENE